MFLCYTASMAPKTFVRNLIIGRPWSQRLFERLLYTSLAGMNAMGGGAGARRSGESRAIAYALAKAGTDPVVFDAGAQGGDYLEVVLELRPGSSLYAFEPAGPAFEWLGKQGYPSNVSLHRLALGSSDGEMELYSAQGIDGLDSLYRFSSTKKYIYKPSGKVRVTSIDLFCEQHGIRKIDLLKLDIEGGEYAALQGAKRMIESEAVPFIQFEHNFHATDAGYHFGNIFALLSPRYRIYRILQHGLREIPEATTLQEMPFTVNYLAELIPTENSPRL
jgi:FkbM family methyltransferase